MMVIQPRRSWWKRAWCFDQREALIMKQTVNLPLMTSATLLAASPVRAQAMTEGMVPLPGSRVSMPSSRCLHQKQRIDSSDN
jgi:hypothetical protein